MKRASIIIPNEYILPDAQIFIRDVDYLEYHFEKTKSFCKINNLEISEDLLNLGDDPVYGDAWHKFVASLGHIVICISEMSVVYLPQLLTEKQREWFRMNRFYFDKNGLFEFAQFSRDGEKITSTNYGEDPLIVDSLYNLIEANLEGELKR